MKQHGNLAFASIVARPNTGIQGRYTFPYAEFINPLLAVRRIGGCNNKACFAKKRDLLRFIELQEVCFFAESVAQRKFCADLRCQSRRFRFPNILHTEGMSLEIRLTERVLIDQIKRTYTTALKFSDLCPLVGGLTGLS
jgi:hypothetical protein